MNKNKIGILAVTFVLTIIVFLFSTHMQKKLIDYVNYLRLTPKIIETIDLPCIYRGLPAGSNTYTTYLSTDIDR